MDYATGSAASLWAAWTLATALTFGVGGRMGGLAPTDDIIVIGYLSLSTSLLLAGALQWVVLRRLLDDAGGWVLAGLGGVATMGAVVFGLGLLNRDIGWVLGVIVGWAVLGLLQAMVLRSEVTGWGWWALANLAGLLAAIPLVALVTWLSGTDTDTALGGLLRWAAFGAGYAAVTGAALLWLLRDRLSSGIA